MTPQGGGDIAEVLRRLGREAVVRELDNAGLRPRNGRARCPFPGCADKAPGERTDSVQLYPGKRGETRLRCHRCGTDGSLVDVIAALRQWDTTQAIHHLKGLEVPTSAPLRLVTPPAPMPEKDRLPARDVAAVWESLVTESRHGQAYLEARGLGSSVALGLVRYLPEKPPRVPFSGVAPKELTEKVSRSLGEWVRKQRFVVGALRDVAGDVRGLQARLVRPPVGKEPKIVTLAGSVSGRAFFGHPHLIEASPVVAVAEGLADTLAVAHWAEGHDACVCGAAGKESLVRLADELERLDVPVEGRIFVLFPQNDRPQNKSRACFERLGQALNRRGARVVFQSTHHEYKDVADWLQAHPDSDWPPPALAELLGGEAEAGPGESAQLVPSVRGALPIPERVRVEQYGQNFASLVALLDDPLHREAVCGRRGDFAFNEMTGEVTYAGGELDDTDVAGMRLRIELHGRSLSDKLLKFSDRDIWQAILYLSKRRKVHPVRDWLTSLAPTWDGVERLEEGLAQAFGQPWPSLPALLLRKWFISAAARGMEPGCKVDTVLILTGDEGLKKSSLFKMLAGGKEYFTSSPIRIGEADGFSLLRRKWIVEWPELDSFKKAASAESVLAFLSNSDDDYRPKWGKSQVSIARSCVIVGTTNEERFLRGRFNRRFWIVNVANIDFDWLKTHREALWAEAAHTFLGAATCPRCRPLLPESRCSQHRWWLEPEHEAELRAQNELHRDTGAGEWSSVLAAYVTKENPTVLTVAHVLQHVVQKPMGQWTRGDEMRAAEAILDLGWRRVRRHRGKVGRFYVPPEAVDELELGVDA
jgi:predicted P-loop ATPase